MEKYCKKCGRVFKDSDFKICPYCGNSLSERLGRQPIPRKLRHQVFQRDGYRCRECGATNKQTRLHVDHIKPVAKGGTNDLSNLQTLCEACNRAKYTDEWVGGNYNSMDIKNESGGVINDNQPYKQCSNCLAWIDAHLEICPYCGSKYEQKYKGVVHNKNSPFKRCPNCLKWMEKDLTHCPSCGTKYYSYEVIMNWNSSELPSNNEYQYQNEKIPLKKCPKCANDINNILDECPYCGYEF